MMFRGRVAAVSYLNTVPFIYGIEHACMMRAGLLLSPPSRCVESFSEGLADIALIPAAAVPLFPEARIVTSYCIGANNPVRTVTMMTDEPVDKIRRIYLDSHSRTSAILIKILCDEFWGIKPEFAELNDYSVAEKPCKGDAFLFIGDKVFDYEGRFGHIYDLAECWKGLTGLPFVFAVWTVNGNVDDKDVEALERSLEYGVNHISEAVAYYGHSGKPYAIDYLTNNIDFVFDDQKHKALSLFWEKGRKFSPIPNPG